MKDGRNVWAVVPIKEFASAKSRLAPNCSPEFRQCLARSMVEDVLCALTEVPELAGIAIVTVEPGAIEVAAKIDTRIRVFEDCAREGHSGAVMAGVRRLASEGYGGILTVPGDIPGITAKEVSQLFATHGEPPAFTIVPANGGRGTNAILMTPSNAVPLAFGDDSFLPHLAAARRLGIEPAILPTHGIGLDIDNFQDLMQFAQTPSRTRTWAFLSTHGLA